MSSENFFQIFDQFDTDILKQKYLSELNRLKQVLQKSNIDFIAYQEILQAANEIFIDGKFDFDKLQKLIFRIATLVAKNVQKNEFVPIEIKAKWSDNVNYQNTNSVGISVLGGGVAAQCFGIAIISSLHELGLFDKKYVQAISHASGACWGSPIAFYDRYNVKGDLIQFSDINKLITQYIEPEKIKYNDLIFKKSDDQLLSTASNPIVLFTIFVDFIRNIYDPNVPLDLVISNAFSQNALEKFNMYSTESILINSKQQYINILENDPDLIKNIKDVFIKKENLPEAFCMTGGYVPGTSGFTETEYTYFPMAMDSNTDGVLAKEAILQGNNFESFEIGGGITNYASGGKLLKVFDEKEKEILVQMKSKYHLMSINQYIGNATAAVQNYFNNNSFAEIFAHRILLNSEKTVPNVLYNSYDEAYNYDLAGISTLLSRKIKNIVCFVSCGQVLNVIDNDPNNLNNSIPYTLLDIFAKFEFDPIKVQIKQPLLKKEDYERTVLGIWNSKNGIYRDKYITPDSPINGIESYEVDIMWVYLNVTEWLEKLDPVSKFILQMGKPTWPYTKNIYERSTLFPLEANAYFYWVSYMMHNYVKDFILEKN